MELEIFLLPVASTALELLSPESSRWETILSLDIVLLRTRGDFWASSWLALSKLAVAAMADSCLFSVELMAVLEKD